MNLMPPVFLSRFSNCGCMMQMSNLSEPSREDASPEVSSPTQKTGACSNTLNTIGQQC
jgi:hypothetical protein